MQTKTEREELQRLKDEKRKAILEKQEMKQIQAVIERGAELKVDIKKGIEQTTTEVQNKQNSQDATDLDNEKLVSEDMI